MNSLDEIETPQFHKLILAYVLIDCRDVLSFLHTLIQPTNDVAGAAKGQLISECLWFFKKPTKKVDNFQPKNLKSRVK